MATFNELLGVMRREVISENEASGGFDNAGDLLPMLYNASAEIAAHLGFPVVTTAGVDWEADEFWFDAPGEMVWPHSLVVNGMHVKMASTEVVFRKLTLPPARTPRYFAFDPREGQNVFFAPRALVNQVAGSVILRYVSPVDVSGLTAGSEVWDGMFPDFHWLVPLRAGSNAWDSLGEPERAQYFNGKFNEGLSVFAARLGVTNVGNLLLPSEARVDRGAP